jgi:hypothetical protein
MIHSNGHMETCVAGYRRCMEGTGEYEAARQVRCAVGPLSVSYGRCHVSSAGQLCVSGLPARSCACVHAAYMLNESVVLPMTGPEFDSPLPGGHCA